MYEIFKNLILPPASLLIVAILALVIRGAYPGGRRLAAASLFLLYLISTPMVGDSILSALEVYPALPADHSAGMESQAIVILSAEALSSPEYSSPSPGSMTLERLRYGAALQRATGLRVLVSGGVPSGSAISLASIMRQSLEDDFHVPVTWVEDQAQDTHQNAEQSAIILKASGIDRVLLVTHAWHMRRAKLVFERAGLVVMPAPTAFTKAPPGQISGIGDGIRGLLPTVKAMQNSYFAFHEILGMAYYQLIF